MMACKQRRGLVVGRKQRPPVELISCRQPKEVIQLFAVVSGWPGEAVAAVARHRRQQLPFRFQDPNWNATSTEAPNETEPPIVSTDDDGALLRTGLLASVFRMTSLFRGVRRRSALEYGNDRLTRSNPLANLRRNSKIIAGRQDEVHLGTEADHPKSLA